MSLETAWFRFTSDPLCVTCPGYLMRQGTLVSKAPVTWVFSQPHFQPRFTSHLLFYLLLFFLRLSRDAHRELACLSLAAASAILSLHNSAWVGKESPARTGRCRITQWLSLIGPLLTFSSLLKLFLLLLFSDFALFQLPSFIPPLTHPSRCPVIHFWSALSYLKMSQVPSTPESLSASCPIVSLG